LIDWNWNFLKRVDVGLERLYAGCGNVMTVEVDLCRTDDAFVATYSCVILHQAIQDAT
jgi:hypothetical protein